MKRRVFILLLGSATAWPLAARAQQGERVRRVAVLMAFTADDPEAQARLLAFAQGLQELGWTVGRNLSTPAGSQAIPTALANTRRNWWRSRRTSSCQRRRSLGAIAAGDPDRADRVRECSRPGGRRQHRQPGAAGWQRHWLYAVRIQYEREMAGAAQRDRPTRDASRSPSSFCNSGWTRAVRGNPGHGAVAWGRVAPEVGLPAFSFSPWWGMFAPKGTPKTVIEKLNGAAVEALADPVVRQRLLASLEMDIFPPSEQTPAFLGLLSKIGYREVVANHKGGRNKRRMIGRRHVP